MPEESWLALVAFIAALILGIAFLAGFLIWRISRLRADYLAGAIARAVKGAPSTMTPASCPSCGQRLPQDAPEGLCPRCLLKEGFRTPPPVAGPPPVRLAAKPHQEPMTARALADLAPRFPQLELLDFVGMGGMGEVYKARQRKLDRAVALKILSPESGADSAFADRFTREARALAKLNHSNIVGIYDFGDSDGLFYFLMEYVDGMNLRQLMQAGRLEPAQALAIVAQICDALQYAHDEGIVHRDIKPENILIDQKGRVKIADFGLAKLLHRTPIDLSLTGTRQVMGTLHYMAPEQIEKPQSVDHRADIYSLGVLFYEMLTGELPLGRFAPPSEKAGTDARLDEIVMHALEKEPDRRYQRVSDVKIQLESLNQGTTPLSTPIGLPLSSAEEEERETLQAMVNGPAIGLIVTAVLALLYYIGMGIAGMLSYSPPRQDPSRFPWIFVYVPAAAAPPILLAVGFMILGARRMMRFESRALCMWSAILGMLPWSAACLVGIWVGIWALVILNRKKVKTAFIHKAVQAKRMVRRVSPPSSFDREIVRLQVIGPAVGLIVTGILAIGFWAVMALTFVDAERDWWSDTSRGYHHKLLASDLGYGALWGLAVLAAAGTIFVGARRLMKLQGPAWAFLAILLAMLPWSMAALVGIPIGIWALIVLKRPVVKAAFARTAVGELQGPVFTPWTNTPIEQPTGPFRRRMRSILQGMQSLFLGSRVKNEPTTDWTSQGPNEG